MFIETETDRNHLIVRVSGRIGGESSLEFYRQTKEIVSANPDHNIILDFKNVDFIDSSGLGSLVAINSHLMKHKRSLTICAVPDNLYGLLKITNLFSILKIVEKTEDAVN